MLSTNQTLHKGRYRVINQFTTESDRGMYEAYDTVSDSNVVLKECPGLQSKVSTPSQREAADTEFFNSAKTLSGLKHSSLVSVHDYFSDIGQQYLVLESVEGFALNKYLGGERPELSLVLNWADQLLNALHFLHKMSPPMIHGEIRPENIRFTSSGSVKLLTTDLNSANASGDNNYQPFEISWHALPEDEQKAFLKDYDARAERVLRGPADARSDLYSVGACIYHVLSGVAPVDALARATALRDKKTDPLKKLSEIAKDIPTEISDAVMKSLEIKRDFRFYSAAVMAQVLRTAVVKVAERSSEAAEPGVANVPEAVAKTPEPPKVVTDTFVDSIPDFAPTEADARQRELEEEQLALEAEQKRIEERRTAIEAERARLEQEAEAERQRMELERRVEEKRLLEAKAEEDRAAATKRLAEIEAEKQKRQAEAEKQEREAEEEREKAEKRLAELHAERERRIAEEQKAAAAVQEELERAEQRLLELSGVDVSSPPDPLDDDVLDLNTNKSAAATSEVPKALASLTDKQFEGFGPSKDYADSDLVFQDYDSSSKSKSKILAVAAAAGILVVAALGWSFLGSSQPAPQAATEPEVTAPAAPPENVVTIQQPAAVPEQSPAPQQVDTYSSTDREVNLGTSQTSDLKAPRPVDTAKPAEKPKKVAQNPTNKPASKKITVDDLINEN